jgi:ribosomal protein S3
MIKNKLHKALVSKYEAERDEALATLEVYYNNPAGIGEHPQVVEEMSKQVEKLANAEDCLNQLSIHNGQ